ncbi:NfeD family protein [Rhizohabitans arisaemae]|uniref:NfeD family protein n=1 Tax=Rhizohabitans arisaemae TaxID=2720610 RepID=UPI0024B155E6|nr:NfeD family protein [Rhizohabitans arisaemae]
MDAWIIWLVLAIVFGVAEIVTLTAALGLLAIAALVTAGTAALGLPVALQFVVFGAASAVGLVLVRPIARRRLRQPPARRFGVPALVGKTAYVTSEVTGRGGRVRLNGEEWSARAYDESLVIPVGTTVDVFEIEGVTALVYPRE